MTANSFSLTTNFNQNPYWDDYDETKGYYRILWKPSLSVQARELNQMQSILQKQIDRFAENIFKDGTLVTGGTFNLDLDYSYVKIADLDTLNNNVIVSEFLGKSLVGETSGVQAIVMNAATGSEIEVPDTKTLFVKYMSSGTDASTKTFTLGETLASNNGLSVVALANTESIGRGSAFTIKQGVVYAKDHFILFDTQTIILDKYSMTPTCRVGFDLTEEIIDYIDDPTLLDNSQGSPNYTAPGADRLKLTAILNQRSFEDDDPNFVELLQIKDGIIQKTYEKTQYSVIRDELARRTYDESGSYVVRGMAARVREHLDDGENLGLYTSALGGNSALLAVGIAPGKAYPFGYDVETLITNYVSVEKGIDYVDVEQQVVSTNYANYVRVNELVGNWNVNDGIVVKLYDQPSRRITTRNYSSTSPAGNQIGTARLKYLSYESGIIGANTGVYQAYLYDVNVSNVGFSAVRSLYYDNASTADAGADVVLQGGSAVLQESGKNISVFSISTPNVRSIRDVTGNVDTTMTFGKTFDVNIGTTGTFTVSTGLIDEIFPVSVGTLSNDQVLSNFNVNLNAAATVSLTGTVSVSNNASTVTGSGTTFTTQLAVGDKLFFDSTSQVRTISAITNNTSLTLSTPVTATVTSSAIKKQYYAGDMINFTVKGSSNVTRTVTCASTTVVSFDMKETLDSTVSATVTAKLNKIDAREKRKNLITDKYVMIDTATHPKTAYGPWSLGVPDIVNLKEVRVASSFSNTTSGSVVTDLFSFDSGQRDTLYDHGALIASGYSYSNYWSTVNGKKLLVKFDYFDHDYSQGLSYFSVDSYPVDDVHGAANTNAITTKEIPIYTASDGTQYNLRDSIDIRPTKTAVSTITDSLTGITTNPTTSTALTVPTGGLHTSVPNGNFILDLSYYLPRKDMIVLDTAGNFRVIRGISSLTPASPTEPADAMAVTLIEVAPYPSLPADIAKTANRNQYANKVKFLGNRRYTMKDIGTLDKRITTLEYYTSLSLLEKDTLDLKILDSDGLDRFKNGILVEPFTSHANGDTNSLAYKCAIDPVKNEVRPRFYIDSVGLKVDSGVNTATTGNLVTLPYSHSEFITQKYATTTRNTAGLMYNFIGELTLNPATDYWTDTVTLPDKVIVDDSQIAAAESLVEAYGTQWDSWSTTWTGTSSSSTSSTSTAGVTTTTTNTTTTDQTRTGTKLVISGTTTSTESYGTSVVDTSQIPYMRSRTINVKGIGFKPSSQLYAFFDSEPVGSYVTPTNSSYVKTASEGSAIITDSNGVFYANFRLPNDSSLKFTTGTKYLRFSDSVTNSSDLGSVTTSGSAAYTAYGTTQTVQETVVSTISPQISAQTLTESQTLVSSSTSSTTVPARIVTTQQQTQQFDIGFTSTSGADPIAQSFTVDVIDKSVPGVFVSKLDLYFSTKDSKYGVFVEIRATDGNGNVTPTVIPYSKVYIPSASVNVSANASVATTVTFPSLVYLLNDTDYAFVIRPEANSPNYALWTSKLGQNDITSGIRVTTQPYSGVLFVSANDKTWSAEQDEDVKFTLYRAQFNTAVTGQVVLVNQDFDYVNLTNVTNSFELSQEDIYGEWRVNLSSVSGGTPVTTNYFVGTTTGTKGVITNISGSTYRVKNVWADTGFHVSEPVTFYNANNVALGITGIVSSYTYPIGKMEQYTIGANNVIKMTISSSTGDFNVGEQIIGRISNSAAIIGSYYNKPVDVFDTEVSQILPAKTDLIWSGKTTSNNYVLDSSFGNFNVNVNTEMTSQKLIVSKYNETAHMSGNKSLQVKGNLTSINDYVSPVLDKSRMHSLLIHNDVNYITEAIGSVNDLWDFYSPTGTSIAANYVTKRVTLADGQDAEDMKIYMTAYMPPGTRITPMIRIKHADDPSDFDNLPYIVSDAWDRTLTYSDASNPNDFKEYVFQFSEYSYDIDGVVIYQNWDGTLFKGYKYFSIKLCMESENSALIPRISDLRVIALQK